MCCQDDRTELCAAVTFGLAPRNSGDGVAQVDTQQNRSATTMRFSAIAAERGKEQCNYLQIVASVLEPKGLA